MATRLETLERLLLTKIALKDGNLDELRKAIDEMLEEARNQRQRKAKGEESEA